MNPASYLYFSSKRPVFSNKTGFAIEEPNSKNVAEYIEVSNNPTLYEKTFMKTYNCWG